MSDTPSEPIKLIDITAELVAAYVARNSIPKAELPNLIRSIHQSLSALV